MNLIEKILSNHTNKDSVIPGEIVDIAIDARVARDFGGANVVKNLENNDLTIDDAAKTFLHLIVIREVPIRNMLPTSTIAGNMRETTISGSMILMPESVPIWPLIKEWFTREVHLFPPIRMPILWAQ
jgi:homoaconitase/3-isopropylmalate dehydratase large subunit